jgi:twitching motility protein PilT
MSLLGSLIAALELTGAERLVLRSGERPHLVVSNTRHDLGTAGVLTTGALEALTDQVLSVEGKRALAERDLAVEPLPSMLSALPVLVAARRLGHELCIELRCQREPQHSAGVTTLEAPTATFPEVLPLPPYPPVASAATPVAAPGNLSDGEPTDGSDAQVKVAAAQEPPQPTAVSIPQPLMRIVGKEEALQDTQAAASKAAEWKSPQSAAMLSMGGSRSIAPSPEPPGTPSAEPENVPVTSGPKLAIGHECRSDTSSLEQWILEAARQEATALYLRAGHAPMVRGRQRIQPLSNDRLDGAVIDAIAAALTAGKDEWHAGSPSEWTRELDGAGPVTCRTFTDNAGTGLVVHLSPRVSVSSLQKDIPPRVRTICEKGDGIVVVSAPAAADVMEMVAAVAELAAQRRAGYVISIEPPNGLGHNITGLLVSARRIAGTEEEVAAVIRRAADEAPDVLVVAVASRLIAEAAIHVAKPGCLVIIGAIAPTTARALEALLSQVNRHAEPELRRLLAASFRCGLGYRVLRGKDGRRTMIHDVVMGTADMRLRLECGDLAGIEQLQRSGVNGMRSFDAALAGAVRRGEISLRQAAGFATDRRDVVRLVRQAARDRARLARDQQSEDAGSGAFRAVAGRSSTAV